MAIGIPIGAPTTVIVTAIPTIINPTPNIPANTRPVIFNIRANKFHMAIKGHINHGTAFFFSIVSLYSTLTIFLNNLTHYKY